MNIEKLKKAAEKLDKKLPEENPLKKTRIEESKLSVSNVPNLATLIQKEEDKGA